MFPTLARSPHDVGLVGGGFADLVAYLESDLRAGTDRSLFRQIQVSPFYFLAIKSLIY